MPDIRTRTPTGFKPLRALSHRTVTGWRPLREVWARTASGWRKLWPSSPPLTVVVSPATQPWPETPPFRVGTTALPSGGVGPYTYAWNDTGPEPVPSGDYSRQSMTWQTFSRDEAFVSVVVTDSLGNTATGSAVITQLG